ncbi:gastrula zinc finger protein XlCGF66.1-like [Rana temporaria]|uniref:gastrula zinc finger protein XlCGF66.1-like n=1 Tax=Rana temporaria TaxID=8407 RepID=UPI001AADAB26|nr:gastrula zinc finger protein XlCGF66.1-like [Rana temporaria]
MEEDWSLMTERILNLTLEIIYQLTGERFPHLKSGDRMTITVPPCDSLKPERHNMEKILEVTKKMMELLTGECGSPGDYNIVVKEEYKEEDEEYGLMEEFSEGHKYPFEDIMKDSPNNRNLPPRYALYFRESTHEDHTVPHHDKGEDLIDIKVEDEETYVRDDQQSMEEDGITGTFIEEDTPTEISTGRSYIPPHILITMYVSRLELWRFWGLVSRKFFFSSRVLGLLPHAGSTNFFDIAFFSGFLALLFAGCAGWRDMSV